MNERVTVIPGAERLVLSQTDGQETLGRAVDIFRYIDSNFRRWGCDVAGSATDECSVAVYEMAQDSTLQEMFSGFGIPLDQLALTQPQIRQFVLRYPQWLKRGGNGTFFLFKGGSEFFVGAVYFFSDGRLGVRVRDLTLARVFRARKHHRLVAKA